MEVERPARVDTAPFCHVVRRGGGKKKTYVVHIRAPRLVVEMESSADRHTGKKQAVIRRVSLPNSWASDYHTNGKRLGEAVAFFEATTDLRSSAE